MNFCSPGRLLLLIPALAVLSAVFYRQYRALAAAEANISRRFIRSFTNYGKINIIAHFVILALACAALAAASAGPWRSGSAATGKMGDRVVFLIDASLSMAAGDVNEEFRGSAGNRGEEAAAIAMKLMEALPGNRYGLVTFSGVAAYNSPPADDREAVKNYLKNMKPHASLKTGTDFRAALEVLVHAAENDWDAGFQGIIISDGEARDSGDYARAAGVLAERGIPVHCVGVGTEDGAGISLFVPEDVMAGNPAPRVARGITTCREESILEDIAETTGGVCLNMENGDSPDALIQAVDGFEVSVVNDDAQGRKDLSHCFVLIFAVIFFLDTLVFDSRPLYRIIESALSARAAGVVKWAKRLR